MRAPDTVLIALMMLLAGAACAQPIALQAEDFACETEAWVATDQTDRYAPDSGLRHFAGASGGAGSATHPVTIPEAGRYTVWVRHTVMAGDDGRFNRGAFALTIRRGDEVLAVPHRPRPVRRLPAREYPPDLPPPSRAPS